MPLSELTSRDAILSAIEEYDALGQDAFLRKYGYGRSRDYVLEHNGKSYDSKAIVGAAYGVQHPAEGPLKHSDFSGGLARVVPVLARLGFQMSKVEPINRSLITSEDIALLRASRTTLRYADLPDDQRNAYERIHAVLDQLGTVVLNRLRPSGSYSLKLTSGYAPAAGVRGALPKDLWFSVARSDSAIGMPQLFMIVSTRGIEYGFAPAIHPSDFSNSAIKEAVRAEAPRIFSRLPPPGSEPVRALTERLEQSGEWKFRRKARLDPGVSDFPSLVGWLEFLKSRAGAEWAGGAISKYILPDAVSEEGGDLVQRMEELADTFEGWIMDARPQASAEEFLQPRIERLLPALARERATTPFGQHDDVKQLMKEIRQGFEELPAVNRNPHIQVSWSLGSGNWAKIPWIALMDDRVTDSTQRGTYIVYLFCEDMSGVFATLNQGITDIVNAEGRTSALVTLRERARQLRAQVSSLSEDGFALDENMNLKTEGVLGQGYQAGTIAYKFYPATNIPKDAAVEADLRALLQAYDRIVVPASAPVTAAEPEAPADARVWIYAPGKNADRWDDFYEKGIMAIGWENLGDLQQYGSVDDVLAALDQHYPTDSRQSNNAKTCFDFAHTIRTGDLIFAKRGRSVIIGHGIVTGDYKYDPNAASFNHVREVRWESRGEWPSPETMALKTLTEITAYPDLVNQLRQLVSLSRIEPVAPLPTADREIFNVDDAMSDLFMPREDVERALRVWRGKKNMILQGAPGVGKSFVAKRLAYALMGYRDPTRVRTVQFHQSYAYEDFVQGYRPDGKQGFELKPGVFLEFCERARTDPTENYIFIIDEINRGNLSRIFGELMLLIEPDKRSSDWATKLAYAKSSEERFYVPPNVYILGLMNTADRSLSLVDYALRRRFGFITIKPQFEQHAFRQKLNAAGCSEELIGRIIARFGALNAEITADKTNLGPGFCIGHSFFVPSEGTRSLDDNWYREILETEIRPLLEEYWSDDLAHADRAMVKLAEN